MINAAPAMPQAEVEFKFLMTLSALQKGSHNLVYLSAQMVNLCPSMGLAERIENSTLDLNTVMKYD